MADLTWSLAVTVAAAASASALATAAVQDWLRRRAILDHPNPRSSHRAPTPRGAGLAVVPVVLAAWLALAVTGRAPSCPAVLLAAAAGLALVSWRDDRRGLGVPPRLAGQALAVAAGLATLPADALIFQAWLPLPLDRLAAGLCWLWFVNLFNFMDGIDGLAGAELVHLGLGLALVALLAGAAPSLAYQAAALAGAGLGFLAWNWHPARVFLGDVGSVPLGYLAGWLLLGAAAEGLWLPALILPLYYLADASLTLARRLGRGERVWEAHREHFYQRAVRRGLDHAQVVRRVLVVNGALLAAAAASPVLGAAALLPAGLAVALLLVHLAGGTGGAAVDEAASAGGRGRRTDPAWPRPGRTPVGAERRAPGAATGALCGSPDVAGWADAPSLPRHRPERRRAAGPAPVGGRRRSTAGEGRVERF